MASEATEDQQPLSLPQINLSEREEAVLKALIPRLREDLSCFLDQVKTLQDFHPEVLENLQRKHPDFYKKFTGALTIMESISSRNQDLSDDDILPLLDRYNEAAATLNTLSTELGQEGKWLKGLLPLVLSQRQLPIIASAGNERLVLQALLPGARQHVGQILGQFHTLEQQYPEVFQNLSEKHPDFADRLSEAQSLLGYLDTHNDLTDQEILSLMDQYNEIAYGINRIVKTLHLETQEDRERMIQLAARGELPFDESRLTPAQKQELRRFSQDLFSELFPSSATDQLVTWTTGQKTLEGYQKVLLAPANGIEWVVKGFVDLLQPQTYRNFVSSIQALCGMSYEDWCSAWQTVRFAWEHLPATDKAAPIISLISSAAFLMGGVSNLTALAKAKGYSETTLNLMRGIAGTRSATFIMDPVAKVLPLSVMAGITLKYFPPAK